MKLVIDIDCTITYAPEFFALLTNHMDAEVIILTFKSDEDDARKILSECNIRYDRLICSSDPELGMKDTEKRYQWKAEVLKHLEADVFFEDMPEVIANVDQSTKIFMAVDEVMQDWIQKSLKKK